MVATTATAATAAADETYDLIIHRLSVFERRKKIGGKFSSKSLLFQATFGREFLDK